MDDIRLGTRIRALRQRLVWRQDDLAERSGVSQDVISRIERGQIAAMPMEKVRAVAHALQAEVVVQLRWRGPELDRLADEGHAALVGRMIKLLIAAGWQARVEVSYSIFGERGSIDILAWHAATRTLLVIEVKTDLVSVEETLRKHDEKVRLAPGIAERQFGWRLVTVARLLVLPDDSTSRRRFGRHSNVLRVAYPWVGGPVRAWVGTPSGPIDGALFLTDHPGRKRACRSLARRRIRGSRAGPTG